jgi:hypothetical protein
VYEANQAMAIGLNGERSSQLATCLAACHVYLLDTAQAKSIIDTQTDVIQAQWHEAADAARLTELERRQLFRREILNEYAFQDLREYLGAACRLLASSSPASLLQQTMDAAVQLRHELQMHALFCRRQGQPRWFGHWSSLTFRYDMTPFAQLAFMSCGLPEPFTDRVRLAMAAYLARFKVAPASTPDRTCATFLGRRARPGRPRCLPPWPSAAESCRCELDSPS